MSSDSGDGIERPALPEARASGEAKEKEKKRSGAAAPWLSGARGPATAGWGGPGGALRAGARFLLSSPDAGMLRIALGVAVALHAGWFAYTLWNRAESGAATLNGPVRFPGAVDMKDAAGIWGGGRPSMATLITGMRNIMDPEGAVERARAQAQAQSEETATDKGPQGEDAKAQKSADGGKPKLDSGEKGEQGKDKKDKEKEAAEALGEGKLAGLSGAGGPGGGQATAASLGTSSAGGPEGAASTAGSGSGPKRTMSAAGGRVLGRAAGSKGALGQLRFADRQSSLGKGGSSAEQAFGAADAAFQGQTAGAGGNPIGGAGAGVDQGPGVGPGTSAGAGSPIRQSPQQQYSCPSGYYLKGSSCAKIAADNKTPYQGLADKAKIFLMMAAALALVGIFLMFHPGVSQIIGGLLLGAAAALVVAALALGNKIGSDYGQKDQQQAVSEAGDKAMKGQAP